MTVKCIQGSVVHTQAKLRPEIRPEVSDIWVLTRSELVECLGRDRLETEKIDESVLGEIVMNCEIAGENTPCMSALDILIYRGPEALRSYMAEIGTSYRLKEGAKGAFPKILTVPNNWDMGLKYEIL